MIRATRSPRHTPKHKAPRRRRWRRAAAVALAASMVATTLAALPPRAVAAPDLSPVADQAELSRQWRVPVVDSQAGAGAALAEGQATKVALPGVPAGHDAALVRLAVLQAGQDTQISAGGAPALSVPAGRSASTAVLLPIVGGAVEVTASVAVETRIELLATFKGDTTAPGSTIALPSPVTRADTAGEQLAGDGVGDDAVQVGLVGLGGVPAENVRAVYTTVTLVAPHSGRLTIDGQATRVRAGTTSFTSVVTPDEDGSMSVSYLSGADPAATGDLRVDVRGWVPEAPQNAQRANVEGSYNPAPSTGPTPLNLPRNGQAPVSAPVPVDSTLALALVAAEPSAGLSLFEIGQPRPGRGSGAVVDPSIGALPQLTVVDVAAGQATAQARGQAVTGSVTWLGGFLGSAPASAAAPTLAITSPADNSTVDLAAERGFSLRGEVAGSAAIESVQIKADGDLIGAARLIHLPGKVEWLYEGTAAGGGHSIEAVATDRAGNTATAAVTLDFVEPAASATVVAPDTVVIPVATPSGEPVVASVTDSQVVFATEPGAAPGDVIVSDAAPGAPEGFLRRVVAVDQVGDTWVVTTEPAALTDALWQVDIDEEAVLLDLGDPALVENHGSAPGFEIIDDGLPAVELLSGDDVDLEPYEFAPDEVSEADVASAAGARSRPVAAPAAALAFSPYALIDFDKTFSKSVSAKAALTWTAEAKRDLSKADAAELASRRSEVKLSGGVFLAAQAQVAVSLRIALKFHVDWEFVVILPVVEPVVDNFRVEAKANVKASAEVDANVAVSWRESYEALFADIHLPTITVMAGIVPVVVTSSIQLHVEAEVSLSGAASFHARTAVSREQTYGFAYSTHGGMQDLSDSSTTYEKPTFGEAGNGLKASIDFEAWAGPRLNFDISIYDAAGPAFQVGVHVGVQANLVFDTTTTPTTKSAAIEVFVGLNARGSVQLKVPIIDKVILSKELKTIADRWPIGSWEWNPNEGVNKSGTTTPPDGIDIPDTNFRACVNQHLGQPDDASITAAQAASLGDLKCLSRGIASLAGLESFPELWYVDLRNNHITDLSALAEANLPALEWLYLGNNQITDLAALAGANLPALKEVGLQDNHITDLSGLAGANLPALDGFHLGNNQITDLVGLAEANLPALGMLDLSSNGITDLSPLAAANLLALGRLYLSDNHITDLSPLAAASLPTLGTLDLSDNQITDLPLLAAANLPNLGMLYLSNNQITDLSPLAGANLPSLGMLDLSNNQIADLPPLAGVPTVRWLYLSNNQITDLSGLAGANLPALEWVYLGNNQITDLSPLAALDYESWVYEQSVSFNGTGLSGRLPLITARDGGSVPLVLSDDGGLDLTITGTTVTASGPGTAVFTWGNGDQSFSGTVALTFG